MNTLTKDKKIESPTLVKYLRQLEQEQLINTIAGESNSSKDMSVRVESIRTTGITDDFPWPWIIDEFGLSLSVVSIISMSPEGINNTVVSIIDRNLATQIIKELEDQIESGEKDHED